MEPVLTPTQIYLDLGLLKGGHNSWLGDQVAELANLKYPNAILTSEDTYGELYEVTSRVDISTWLSAWSSSSS